MLTSSAITTPSKRVEIVCRNSWRIRAELLARQDIYLMYAGTCCLFTTSLIIVNILIYFFFFLFEVENKMGFSQCLTNHTDVSVSLHPLAPSVPALASGFVSRGMMAAWPPTSFGCSEGAGSGSLDVDSVVPDRN